MPVCEAASNDVAYDADRPDLRASLPLDDKATPWCPWPRGAYPTDIVVRKSAGRAWSRTALVQRALESPTLPQLIFHIIGITGFLPLQNLVRRIHPEALKRRHGSPMVDRKS
jgi:hypothetical protein